MVIAETSVLEGTQHEIKESCETKCWMCGKICDINHAWEDMREKLR